ncbi:hypothetical protein [Streptomyces sioyaensis]|uniref:hypothetical protein n=1 Tax=Streptomyces sioyaensis TaxID=67364 RepID=UPI0036E5B16E
MIVDAITSFLGMLIEQVMKPVHEFLADTLLATPDVTKHADVKRLWAAMLKITFGIYVLFVTAGGITVMGYETVQTRYALKQILPRLLLGAVAATTSLTVMGKAIGLANALAHAIMATDMADYGQGMVERVLPFALFGVAGLRLYLLLLAILMVALVLAVLIGSKTVPTVRRQQRPHTAGELRAADRTGALCRCGGTGKRARSGAGRGGVRERRRAKPSGRGGGGGRCGGGPGSAR